jgi:DNA-binding protein YbaB
MLRRIIMPDFTDMLSKAKEMQAKMKDVQDAIKNIEVEGEAGGNLVKDFISVFPDAKLTSVTEEEDA